MNAEKIPLLPLPPHYINGHPRHVTSPIKRLEELGAKNWCLRPPRHTHRSWEVCAKNLHNDLCSNQSLQKHFPRFPSSCRFSAISVPNDRSPLGPEWWNTFISQKILKHYLAKIYSSLSQLQVALRNLELFLAQGGLTPLQVLLKRERALSWPLLQQLANAPLSLFRATHILTLPSVTATVSLYLFFTHCLKILCFIYRVFFSLVPP